MRLAPGLTIALPAGDRLNARRLAQHHRKDALHKLFINY
jgi:hypothetical protein